MKHKIIKLSFLVLLMNVLTASKETTCVNTMKDSLNKKDTSAQVRKVNAASKATKQNTVVKETGTDNTNEPLADYKLPLVPFSRFIL